MLNVVGLRPKWYSYKYEKEAYFETNEHGNEVEVDKPKDTIIIRIIVVNKNTGKWIKDNVRKELTIEDYESSSITWTPLKKGMNTIWSDHHKIYTHNMKTALMAFYNKRWF